MNDLSPVEWSAPIILSDKREQLIRFVMQGLSQREAWLKVYPNASPTSADAAASRVLGSIKVRARMAQIRAAEAAARKIDLPFLTEGLLTAYRLGLQTKQASAAAQAMMGVAKLHGFVIDRAQVDQIIRKPSLDPSSPDEMSESTWLTLTLGSTVEGSGAPSPEPRDSTDQATPSTDQV